MSKLKQNPTVRTFVFYQDKKSSIRLKEEGNDQVLGSIYLSRNLLVNPTDPPKRLRITVEEIQ